MTAFPPNDPQDFGGVLSRINQFGAATERLFSQLYAGLTRQARQQQQQSQRAELESRIEKARLIESQNEELRQALRNRAAELERLHGMLSVLDEGLVMQDNDGRIIFMNAAARELLGSQKNIWESELGVLFNNYSHVTTVPGELTPLGAPTSVQINNRVVGAQLAAVANNGGERLGTMLILRDITQDTLADRLKEQFVTALSHELKTPMTVIKGMSEVLLGSPQDQPANRRFLETLSRNVDILDRMIVELLDVSEMGAGTFDIRQTPLALDALLNSVIKGVAPDLKQRRQHIFFMTREAAALRVRGDDRRLRWAFGHLVQNSIRYTLPGGQIVVSAAFDPENTRSIRVTIQDTGVGISEKDLPHIFDRFYRGDPRDPSGKLVDPRGLGQGLFIARTVAEAHGGSLGVRSTVGEGSVFTLALPAPND